MRTVFFLTMSHSRFGRGISAQISGAGEDNLPREPQLVLEQEKTRLILSSLLSHQGFFLKENCKTMWRETVLQYSIPYCQWAYQDKRKTDWSSGTLSDIANRPCEEEAKHIRESRSNNAKTCSQAQKIIRKLPSIQTAPSSFRVP